MSLSDLIEHAPAQEEAISKLPSGALSGTRAPAWIDFRTRLWGNESFQKMELVKRGGIDPVGSITLSNYHLVATVPSRIVHSWGLERENIFVPSEYNKTEQTALLTSRSEHRVLVVSGPPSTPGKSVFLLWLLMHRLALRLPTVLQVSPSHAILFHAGGVFELTGLDNLALYGELFFSADRRSSRIWALVDSSPNLPEPAGIFKYNTPFFVVNAASSGCENLGWFKKTSCKHFFMNSWSIPEVL